MLESKTGYWQNPKNTHKMLINKKHCIVKVLLKLSIK